MLDLDKMSAPTSLTMATSKAQQQQQQQQRSGSNNSLTYCNSLRSTTSNSEMAAAAAARFTFGANHQVAARNPAEQLIDSKFNELAKRILDELKQAQYAKEFFQAIDDILREPVEKSFAHKRAAVGPSRRRRSSASSSSGQRGGASNQYTNYNEYQQMSARQQQQQPRSLPADVVAPAANQQQQQQQKSSTPLTQQQQARHQPVRSSAIPTISAQYGYTSPSKVARAGSGVEGTGRPMGPIIRSATTGDAPSLKRQQSLKASAPVAAPELILDSRGQPQQQQFMYNHKSSIRTNRNYPAGSVLANNYNRYHDNDDDDDDDDDDDEDDDDDDENGFPSPDVQLNNNSLSSLNQRFSIASKSKTMSDTPIISEMNPLTAAATNRQQQQQQQQKQVHLLQQQQQPPQLQQQQQQQQSIQKQRQRFNPIVRSNTISSSTAAAHKTAAAPERDLYGRDLHHQYHSHEPRSVVLNSKDIGSLYKPHMNYSTSVLGNHRLSDDDEIIIIPTTQSPSLLSGSPIGDNEAANGDDLTERFSISRTKSFWEKLSKGNGGKRSAAAAAAAAAAASNKQQPMMMEQQQQHLLQHHHNPSIDSSPNNTTISSSSSNGGGGNNDNMTTHSLGNKVIGVRMNGHSHTLDRMDSTGGSQSNYSCSSSGDENGGGGGSGGSHSHHTKPTISQLQEMSRQNRFRQTR